MQVALYTDQIWGFHKYTSQGTRVLVAAPMTFMMTVAKSQS